MDTIEDKDISEVLTKDSRPQTKNPKHKCKNCGKPIKFGEVCHDCKSEK